MLARPGSTAPVARTAAEQYCHDTPEPTATVRAALQILSADAGEKASTAAMTAGLGSGIYSAARASARYFPQMPVPVIATLPRPAPSAAKAVAD